MAFSSMFMTFGVISTWLLACAASIVLLIIGAVKHDEDKRREAHWNEYYISQGYQPPPYKKKVYPKVFITVSLTVLVPTAFLMFSAALLHREPVYTMNELLLRGDYDGAQEFLDSGECVDQYYACDPGEGNEPASGGKRSLLHKACDDNNIETVRFLLNNGADTENLFYIHEKDHEYHVIRPGNGEFRPCSCGNTPLLTACSMGDDSEITELLLKHGADVNAVNYSGVTALMYAAYCGGKMSVRNAELLINAGADISLKDNFGHTALDYAKKYGSTELTELISNAQMKRYNELVSEKETSSFFTQFSLLN